MAYPNVDLLIKNIIADPELKGDQVPEQQYYDATDYRNELLDQIDAVRALINPDLADRYGLKAIDSVMIAKRIDKRIDAKTVDEMIGALKEMIAALQDPIDAALNEMAAYPEDVKAEILPELQDRHQELVDRHNALFDQDMDLDHFGQPLDRLGRIRAIRITEREINDMHALIMVHEPQKAG